MLMEHVMLRYRQVKFATFCKESELLSTANTLSFFLEFYKNIEAQICATFDFEKNTLAKAEYILVVFLIMAYEIFV